MICFGNVPAGSVLPIFFDSYAGSTGASATISGLAVTDIEIYKGTSMTQRSSDAGYVLLDTDGIDLDGTTGINGFSVDLGDNTDAGFFVAGSFYNVVVSAITVDSQTVNFVAATFRIVAAEGTAGTPVADATRWNNLATVELPLVPTTAGRKLDVSAGGEAGVDWANVGGQGTSVNLSATTTNLVNTVTTYTGNTVQTGDSFARIGATGSGLTSLAPSATALSTANWTTARAGYQDNINNANLLNVPAAPASTTNITAGTITTATNLTNAATAGDFTAAMKTSIGTAVAASAVASVTGDIGGLSAGAITDVAEAVWDAVLASYQDPGSTGEALGDAGAAGDPWGTALPGAYGAGTAGQIVGDFLDVAVSSRMATFVLPTNFAALAITAGGAVTVGTNGDKTGYTLTAGGNNAVADALLARNVAGGSSAGRIVSEALYVLRNKVDTTSGTVYGVDDATPAFTFSVTTAPGDPITIYDPS